MGIRLDIGCGLNQMRPLDEWMHHDGDPGEHVELVSDIGSIDLPDKSCSEIRIGDVIEHIPKWRVDQVLCEWNRLLEIGGICTGNTPNADRAMRDYADGKETFHNVMLALYGWGDRPYQQHYVTYKKGTLEKLLRLYGFGPVDFGDSPGPVGRPWWLVFRCVKERDVLPGTSGYHMINHDEGL